MSTVEPQVYPALPKPTSADVAAILRARTKDLAGIEIGDFTDDTRPTGAEVVRLIDLAYNEVTGAAGMYLAPRCAGLATSLIVVRTAMWVEGSYWPEQVRSDRSIYAELSEQYAAGMPVLMECAAGNLPGDGGDGGAEPPAGLGMLNVHGWTSTGYFEVPPPPTPT